MRLLKKLLENLPFRITHPIVPSVGLINYSILTRRARNPDYKAHQGLEKCLEFQSGSVVDVGSGDGVHSVKFLENGWEVTAIDLREPDFSVNEDLLPKFTFISENIIQIEIETQFDLVWSSHCLEHQLNANLFISRLISLCKPNGRIAISVPFPHRRLLGGHVSMWTPGLLLYHLAIAGVNCTEPEVILGDFEFTVIVEKIQSEVPELSYDKGDVDKLAALLPRNYFEGGDQWGKWPLKHNS